MPEFQRYAPPSAAHLGLAPAMLRRARGWPLGWSCALAVAAGCALVFAQQRGASPEGELDLLAVRVTSFLEDVAGGQAEPALRKLIAGSPLESHNQEASTLLEAIGRIEERFGSFWGLEQLDVHRLGEDVATLRYLYKCDRYPLVWQATFYRTRKNGSSVLAEGDWQLIRLRFDNDLDAGVPLPRGPRAVDR